MNQQDSSFAASAICHAADMVKIAWQEAAWDRQRPSVLHDIIPTKDGDMWCALMGDNLQEGIAGFGPTPAKALYAFDTAFHREDGSYIIERELAKAGDA